MGLMDSLFGNRHKEVTKGELEEVINRLIGKLFMLIIALENSTLTSSEKSELESLEKCLKISASAVEVAIEHADRCSDCKCSDKGMSVEVSMALFRFHANKIVEMSQGLKSYFDAILTEVEKIETCSHLHEFNGE